MRPLQIKTWSKAESSLIPSCVADDGLCYVQPILEKGATVGHASSSEVGQAAFTMLQACVVERGIGGEAYNIGKSYDHVMSPSIFRLLPGMKHGPCLPCNNMVIGGDNKVNVVIADYKPKVKCDVQATEAPEWLACVTIFISMKASKKVQIFGASDDEAVEQELPLVLEAGKHHRSSSIICEIFPSSVSVRLNKSPFSHSKWELPSRHRHNREGYPCKLV